MMAPDDNEEAREEWIREKVRREELMDAGLDPNDPDVTELAPEGMYADENDE